ncbi:WD40-repeat-containing domain protein [Aspergillus pseudodeflectus]|uniref:WD40-repeat-containing domain protein n=1 Tax=Aspergillus pseudodeflectus TaxID=176178 RepID=A0ABR4KMK1_9EURO
MNREIPGFYFDPEKKKYFKIQANHKSTPGSQYSKDAVKRKRADQEKRQRKARFIQRAETEKIKRSASLRHPLFQIQRETGVLPSSRSLDHEQQGLAYASQLCRAQLHEFEPWPDQYTIKHVVRNPRSGILIASGHRGGESSVSVCFPDFDQEKWTYNRTMERLLFKEQYRLSSLSLSHTGYLLATMDSGPNGDSFLAPRMLPDPDEGGDYRWPPFFSHPIRIHTTSSLWCSSSSPTGDVPRFAVGTSDGLYTLEGFGSYWALSKKGFPASGNPKHRRVDSSHALITAVEWLSSDVIAAGLKDSTIFLHDIRSGGSAARLQHPHAVTKIRNIDPYRIVVAGINSLQMYDIRYPPNGLQRNPNPNHKHHTSTRPYLSFLNDAPEFIPDFDVSPELGLLASASDDHKIQLFSLRTGEGVISPLTKYQYRDPITSVCFESGGLSSHAPQTPSLLVCSEATVDEWIW